MRKQRENGKLTGRTKRQKLKGVKMPNRILDSNYTTSKGMVHVMVHLRARNRNSLYFSMHNVNNNIMHIIILRYSRLLLVGRVFLLLPSKYLLLLSIMHNTTPRSIIILLRSTHLVGVIVLARTVATYGIFRYDAYAYSMNSTHTYAYDSYIINTKHQGNTTWQVAVCIL